MQAERPKQRWERAETSKQLILRPLLVLSRAWPSKCLNSSKKIRTHSWVAIHPDRDRKAVHQPAHQATTGSVPNLCRSLCYNSINVLILSYVPSMNNFIPRTLVWIGNELLPLFVVIHSMWMVIYRSNQKTLMITKRFHLMKHQVLGMWWMHISSHKYSRRRTPRSNPKSKMIITILGVKWIPLHLRRCKRKWDSWLRRLIHQLPQRNKHKVCSGRQWKIRICP